MGRGVVGVSEHLEGSAFSGMGAKGVERVFRVKVPSANLTYVYIYIYICGITGVFVGCVPLFFPQLS